MKDFLTCDMCTGSGVLSKIIDRQLEKVGIEPRQFKGLSPVDQVKLIIERFHLDKTELNLKDATSVPMDLGMIVIKPELRHADSAVTSFLSSTIGVDLIQTRPFTYTPAEHYQISGKAILDHPDIIPHGPLLFLVNTSAPSHLVTFRHLTVPQYIKKYSALTGVAPDIPSDTTDLQYVFDNLFVKTPYISIRSLVSAPEIRSMGLHRIQPDSCAAACWDYTRQLVKRTEAENCHALNGVHSPSNHQELETNIAVLSRLIS